MFNRNGQCFSLIASTMLALLLGGVYRTLSAQPPVVSRVEPGGIVPGKTTEIAVHGTSLTGARWLTTTLGVTAELAGDIEGNGTNGSRAVFRVDLPANTPLGIHGVRVISSGGASRVQPVFVDDLPSVQDSGSNRTIATAQEVAIPCAVDGHVDGLGRDFYRFAVQPGDRLTLDLFARRIGSPLDPLMVLYDENGHALVSVDDLPGLASDCQLSHTFLKGGNYIVEVRDIQYRGGANHDYRLRIGKFPAVSLCWPMAVQRGTATSVMLVGENQQSRKSADSVAETSSDEAAPDEAGPIDVTVPADWPFDWYAVSIPRVNGESQGFAMVQVTDRVELIESEPNDTLEQATPATFAANLNGRLSTAGDVDLYRFTAVKGGHYLFQGLTRGTGSPADIILKIKDATGKQLMQVDDTGTGEGLLDVTFPADGDYLLEVAEFNQRHGAQFAYRVTIEEFQPGFSLTADADVINVPAGGVGTVNVTAVRRGFGGPIELTAVKLPAGVTASSTVIGPGTNSAVLTLVASSDATVVAWSTVDIVGTATMGDRNIREVADISATVQGGWSNTQLLPVSVRDGVVMAVESPRPLSLRVEPSTIVFGPQLKGTIRVIATRGEGVDEAITLATVPDKGALPAGITLALNPIAKGMNEVTLEWTATDKAPLGEFSVVLVGTHKQDKTTLTIPTAAYRYRLDPPFQATIEAASDQLAVGGEWKGTVKLQRNPSFVGAVKVSGGKLPPGVTFEAVQIPADQEQIEIVLKGADDAAKGTVSDVSLTLEGVENAKLTGTVTLPPIKIE